MPTPSFAQSAAVTPEITIKISAVINREFKRRGVFPELRPEHAIRVISGSTAIHMVSIELARKVHAYASEQHIQSTYNLPRGASLAYGALARNIYESLKHEARRGAVDDPGFDGVKLRQAAASACFDVGDSVLYFRDGETYGRRATVVMGYQMSRIFRDNGMYIRGDQRFDYQYGYSIQLQEDGRRFFTPAYQLTRDDCKPSYLRLVVSQ